MEIDSSCHHLWVLLYLVRRSTRYWMQTITWCSYRVLCCRWRSCTLLWQSYQEQSTKAMLEHTSLVGLSITGSLCLLVCCSSMESSMIQKGLCGSFLIYRASVVSSNALHWRCTCTWQCFSWLKRSSACWWRAIFSGTDTVWKESEPRKRWKIRNSSKAGSGGFAVQLSTCSGGELFAQ